jgi:2-amino-4-hydroxy-6-hydroxymethyldihydropteridine diphosphokinase
MADFMRIDAVSSVVTTRAIGPAGREFANAAVLSRTRHKPEKLLAKLKKLERSFGRRAGRRWGPRVLDLDIVLWSGGVWAGPQLAIPHAAFRNRLFVLDPLASIAADWRDPVTGLTVAHLAARAHRPVPVDRKKRRP